MRLGRSKIEKLKKEGLKKLWVWCSGAQQWLHSLPPHALKHGWVSKVLSWLWHWPPLYRYHGSLRTKAPDGFILICSCICL